MRIRMLVSLVFALAVTHGWAQTNVVVLVSQVHWITIHVRTPAAFESLCALLGGDLQLPVYFGPESHGARRYEALLAAPVILEVCGPFPDSPYRATNVLARYNTLTFRAATTAAATSAGLSTRGLAHEPPRTEPWDKTAVQVNVTALSSTGMPVSVMQRVEDAEGFDGQLSLLREKFREGGSLGIRGLDEIHIAYSDEKRLARWQTFLNPIASTNGSWTLHEKPALCFVRSDRDEVVALVFRVESLPRAALQLKQRGLLGESRGDMIGIAPDRACGLRILFRK